MAVQTISEGTVAGLALTYGNSLTILAGGSANMIGVSSGARVDIAGGSITNVNLSDGGRMFISAGSAKTISAFGSKCGGFLYDGNVTSLVAGQIGKDSKLSAFFTVSGER